ncbi:MAG: cytochrome c [Nitrospirota bacterium]
MKNREGKLRFFLLIIAVVLISFSVPLMAENKKTKETDYTDKDAWKGKGAEAKSNYAMYCSPCHGDTGKGNGPQAEAMEAPPRNHTDGNYLSTRTDDQLFKAIKGGGPAMGFTSSMPPFDNLLTEEEIKGMVKYVRTLCNCEYKKIGAAR